MTAAASIVDWKHTLVLGTTGLVLVLLFYGAAADWPLLLFNLSAVFALGVALDKAEVLAKPSMHLVYAWAAQAGALVLWLGWRFPGTEVGDLERMTIPSMDYVIRYPLDLIGVAGSAWGILSAYRAIKSPFGRGLAALSTCFLATVILKNVGGSEYILLWANNVGEINRAVGLFDLGNALWLSAAIPLLAFMQREGRSLFAQERMTPVLWLVIGLPVVIVIVTRLTLGTNGSILDALSVEWWVRRLSATFIWTATYEEVVWRVAVLGWSIIVLSDLCSRRWTIPGAVALATILYVVAHAGGPASVLLSATVFGVCAGVVMVKTGNILVCIVAHLLVNIFGSSWT